MKIKLLSFLAAVALGAVVAGCVSTVTGGHAGAVPFTNDKVQGMYERPMEDVFNASRATVQELGTVINENTLYDQTNATKTLFGRVAQSRVWIRCEQVDPKVALVQVQARTSGGGSDMALIHEIEKRIALKLVR